MRSRTPPPISALRRHRRRLGLSIDEIARRIGRDRTTVWRWERRGRTHQGNRLLYQRALELEHGTWALPR